MIDQDLKKKIVNTISGYETKCDKMQLQINALKNVINQLIITPLGINYDMDEQLSKFREYLDEEFNLEELERKVNSLVKQFVKIEHKKTESARLISGLIKQSVDSLSRIATKSYDKRAVDKLYKMLETGVENQVVLVQFNEALTRCVSLVIQELEQLSQASSADEPVKNTDGEISQKINDSLQQLIDHLSIPQALDVKKEEIKTILEHPLTSQDLNKIIDGLTDLVVDAFNVEQNRFKGFLQQLTNQLQDFDVYLKVSSKNHAQGSLESRQLETGIQDNIDQIKNHLDNSTTIEELSIKVSQNLKLIGDRIRTFRKNQQRREKEFEQQVVSLQTKLTESQQNAEEIRNLLTFQKYRINHDSLTGLPNREAYDEYLTDSFQRWKMHSRPLSLAVGDIDHFKHINDNFGHLAGDKVLKKVAMIFKSSVRSLDFISRFGGEEFVFIFEETPQQQALTVLEKLRKLVEECQFYYQDKKVDVTVSFGLTTVTDKDDLEHLFMRADKAMYKAKNSGRNRIEIL
ncbi:GGDEF domain-containing protein [Legionella worsleiensis]|uniref:diguanylate cyclase n=1 Tax=Legionella worsleiensis TaxID=45076 RepID=A0A0W1A4B1_9GAMM|nr:GGDEF domain-containing protein [Legionella worsleiensis]KTD75843.1 GGDEF domain-containing protein [Legionella worsleiensis]STY32856.1 diguanylate cyclase [Legionella worsleiensis]